VLAARHRLRQEKILPHVRWWFDRRNELKDCITSTDNTNERASNYLRPVAAEKDAADENVN
jgi:hypothetical protein